MKDPELIKAAVLHPRFKLRWLPESEKQSAIDQITEDFEREKDRANLEHGVQNSRTESHNKDLASDDSDVRPKLLPNL